MALVVDKTVKYLNVPDSNNFTIKCSKPMSQLSVDDVKSADFWVGFTSFAHNQMGEGNVESGLPQNDPNHCWCWATDPSCLYEGDWSTAHWSYPANYPTGVYMRNILVECAAAHTQDTSLQNDASARIVLDIEAGEDTKLQDLFISGSSYVTCPYGNENRVTDYRYIKPAILMIVNDVLYVWIQAFAPRMSGFYCDSSTSQGYRSSQSYDDYAKYPNHYLSMGWTRALETGNLYDDSGTTTSVNFNYTVPDVDFNGVTADLNVSLGAVNYHKRASVSIIDNEDKEIEKWYTAFTGFKFKVDDVWYKPIVEGGIVTGYTDDMTVMSEWDEWDNITGHNVPITPPSPTPSGDDDYESMTTGFASTLSGCTKYYLMSPLDIVTLIRDYYTHAFAGSTLSNSIISCYLCGLSPAEFISTETPAPIKIPTVAGETIFESVNSYKAIDAVVNKIQVGNIEVPRMNNDFHDFSPYTIYEVFIPYCGWISLPDTVAGKYIYVEFHVDVRTMAGKAIVLIGADDGGKATCAEISMNFGASTPFAVIEAGLERQAAVTAGIQTAIGTAAAITGINSGHNALTVSSIGTAVQGIANGMMSSMANYTQVQGKAGDTSDFANGRQCYLKISWAKTDEVVNNSRFGHTVGYLCNTVGKIKDFKGLTVCANPHVTGIDCTESEKEEIKRLLEEGIIVN